MPDNSLPEKVLDLNKYQTYSYDLADIVAELVNAPSEISGAENDGMIIALPGINGQ